MELCCKRRRQFLLNVAASLGLTLSAGSLSSLILSCESDITKPSSGRNVDFDVSTEPALASVGGVVKRGFGSNNGGMPVFIVRKSQTGTDAFVVLSSRCTHQGCEVNLPAQQTATLMCPCHLAEFDPLTGSQTKPPSGSGTTGPLQRFTATFNPQTNILTIQF